MRIQLTIESQRHTLPVDETEIAVEHSRAVQEQARQGTAQSLAMAFLPVLVEMFRRPFRSNKAPTEPKADAGKRTEKK